VFQINDAVPRARRFRPSLAIRRLVQKRSQPGHQAEEPGRVASMTVSKAAAS
jgi:hypothetical protein